MQKHIAAISDLSCLGRCSLTVALPIISAAGVEASVIPTAVLSTHTGGFGTPVFKSMSPDMLAIARHWSDQGITVDAVYTGYLCSKEQIYLALEAARLISREDTLLITDPVMGDNGRLYSGFDKDFPKYMLKICAEADIILPNITEAALMLGIGYREPPYSEEYINTLLSGLYFKTHAKTVLTGVCFDGRKIGAAVFEGEHTEYVFSEHVPGTYHGTGDIFASTLVAALMNGRSLRSSAQTAASFTSGCVRSAAEAGREPRYGVNFEAQLPQLIKYLRD